MNNILTDEECQKFRAMPCTFNEMLQAVYQAGRISVKEEVKPIEDNLKETIKAAAGVLLDAITDAVFKDPHQWSDRPCETCRVISVIVNKPFGCYKYQERKKG